MAAISQYKQRQLDYIGCMKRGNIVKDPHLKWYEPQHVGTALFPSLLSLQPSSTGQLPPRAAHLVSRSGNRSSQERLGDGNYFSHAFGPMYILSGRAAGILASHEPDMLRHFMNEGESIAAAAVPETCTITICLPPNSLYNFLFFYLTCFFGCVNQRARLTFAWVWCCRCRLDHRRLDVAVQCEGVR
jgi:hypothetical protein